MDEKWVEGLVLKYQKKLTRYFWSHTGSWEDSEDMAQDVFLAVMKHREEFDPARCGEEAWLFIAARNRLVSYYRSKKQTESLDAMEEYRIPGRDETEQAENLMACRSEVAKALDALDERARAIVVLFYFKGRKDSEIAEITGTNAGNVRVIRKRALEKMAKTADISAI